VTDVRIELGDVALDGSLELPDDPLGIVLFAHGSGSSRHSHRNRYVAAALQERRFATLLMDLLTAEEEQVDVVTRHLRFDVHLLADRLAGAAYWLAEQPVTAALPAAYFGASTGAAAALVAASEEPARVFAAVSRGGRPDLAGDALAQVRAPTLLIVGGRDEPVIQLNQEAQARMRCETALEIVSGATHLFEETGALEEVAALAAAWFERHVPAPHGTRSSRVR
jgi:putative phosphoribosyl transferase